MPSSDSTTYLGVTVPNPRAVGGKSKVTQKQAREFQEFRRCATDPIYFIQKYVKIDNVDGDAVSFTLLPFQRKLVRHLHTNRFAVACLPRQCGKSITTLSYLLWVMLFHSEQSMCIFTHKPATSRKLLNDFKKLYLRLPKWLQEGIIEWNKGNIEIENGSTLMAASISSDITRGHTFDIIFLDEFATIPSHLADEFAESVYPTISRRDTKIMVVSSLNEEKDNPFRKIWTEANYPPDSKTEDMRWNGYAPFCLLEAV